MRNTKILLIFAVLMIFAAGTLFCEEIISEISVEGNIITPSHVIIEDSGLSEGDEFSSEDVRESVRRLYAKGYLEDVNVRRLDENGGLRLVFEVKERPVIAGLSFEGNSAFNDRRLQEVTELRGGARFLERDIDRALEEILFHYRAAGFAGVSVEEDIEKDPETGKVNITFSIEEGVPVRKINIEFSGNAVFSDREIRAVMQTGRRGIFRAQPYRREVLDEDLQRIVFLYHGKGYIDADVSLDEVVIDLERREALVKIDIKEGQKYVVRDIDIPGEYADLIGLDEGDAFSPEQMQSDIRSIYEHLYEQGLLYAEVRAERSVDREEMEADVRFLVREGPVVYVERILISGNLRTRDDVIRRELRIKPGDRFDITKIRQSQRRIQNLGTRQPFFERVTFEIEDGTDFDRKNLHFKVVEGKTGSLLFGVGYSSDDKLAGFAEANVDNFDIMDFPGFMGAGQDLSVKAEIGSEQRNYTLSFTEPWLFHVPLSFGVDLYDRLREWSEYDEGRDGGRLRLGYPLGDKNRISLGYKYEDVDISNFADEVSREIRREEGVHTLSTLSLGLRRDTRDSFFDPRSGARSGITSEFAGGPFSGDKDFRKYTARTSIYYPAWPGGALNFRLEGGYAEAFGVSDVVPVYERFYLGGADTVRGYPYRDIGPKDETGEPIGGDVRFMANLEYTIPILRELKGAVFVDVGNVWRSRDDFAIDDLVSGVGIGVRIMSPLGPLRLDYAYGFDRNATRLHFTIGWPM